MATKLIVGVNDLASKNPSLADEWDYEKNGDIRPDMFTAGSSKKMYWVGACGHRWAATIASRNSGVGCPECARKNNAVKVRNAAVIKHGSLKDSNPELLSEWNYTKNADFEPDEVASQSHQLVWWVCSTCGNEWQAIIRNRVKGSSCPRCILAKKKTIKPKKVFVSLSDSNPQVALEWHPTRNGELLPGGVSAGSHTKVWWKCKNGHEWQATPNHRTSKVRNCPYCCANPRVLSGENDLATLNPDLAKEWNYERNGTLTPDKITVSSSRSVWWKCSLGHEWKTAINHRNDGSGCPKCAKGKQTSFPEQAIFYYISKIYTDAINGYTELFNNHGMELDIYIPSLKIGIEYDGIAFHRTQTQKKREEKKYTICRNAGIQLIRIREDIMNKDDSTCDYLITLTNGLDAGIKALKECGILVSDVDVERDQNVIEACYRNMLKENSLLNQYPEIATEWDYPQNAPLTPDMFSSRSNRTVWWKCRLGHSWKAKLDSRVRGTGCPYCSNNKVLSGFNDFAHKRTDLMQEWDWQLNANIDPTKITPGSGKKAWWKCPAGHSWNAEISSRNKGHGCPYCAGNRVE